jgi:hypothetical protein
MPSVLIMLLFTFIGPLDFGKCIGLPQPNRAANLDVMKVNCYYTWGLTPAPNTSAQFIPMIRDFGMADKVLANPTLLAGQDVVMLFNECDACVNCGQCVGTPEQAAAKTLQLQAALPGRQWIAPAVHNWGSPGWIDEYMAACQDCQIDAIAIHYYSWYPCQTDDFIAYVESFKRFGQQLWLTEYGCLAADPAYRLRYYRDWYCQAEAMGAGTIMPWVENVPSDWPYWWRWGNFANEDNTLTELGQWYKGLDGSCKTYLPIIYDILPRL